VLRSGVPVTLVPLDATNQVPVSRSFYEGIAADHDTPVARFVLDVLGRRRDELDAGGLFFWDQLAAVALTEDVAASTRRRVNVTRRGALAGWTSEGSGGAPVRVAGRVDRTRFERVFLSVLADRAGSEPAS
jgi:inosine-uridine nucleoside N-ribohydrolase